MFGSSSAKGGISSLLRCRGVSKAKKRTIVVGLKSDNSSRDMLLRVINFVAMPGDYVLSVRVQEPNDTFDPNTFHIHEDLCKSKQVILHSRVSFYTAQQLFVTNIFLSGGFSNQGLRRRDVHN